jgi:hypothetical protein
MAGREDGRGSVTLSYIEGWHAIAEANRVFGFEGWDRETVVAECSPRNRRRLSKPRPTRSPFTSADPEPDDPLIVELASLLLARQRFAEKLADLSR